MSKPTNSIQAQMKTNLVSTYGGAASTGALVTTTSALNINNGELAMLESDIDSANHGEITTTPTGGFVKLIQGTPKSNATNTVDPWGVSDPAYVESANIDPRKVRNLTTTNYSSGSFGMSMYTTAETFVVNSSYGFIVELDGRRQEREFGENTDQRTANVVTPAVAPTDIKDYVFQNNAFKLNQFSSLVKGNRRFVVLGVNLSGGAGTVLSAIVNDNAAIPFQTQDGVTYTIQSSTPFVRAIGKLIAASTLLDASTIEVLDPTTAGAAAKVDALIVVGLDAELAVYEDDLAQVRTDVTINPKDELEGLGTIVNVYPMEAINHGRGVSLANDLRAQLDIHTKQLTPYLEQFSTGYKYLSADKNYGSFIIDFYDTENTVDHTVVHEKQATIYWEQTEPITLSTDGVAVGTTAVGVFVPTETVPAVVGTFTTWKLAND